MNLYDRIFSRCSTRKFEETPLSESELKELEAFIAKVIPLLPDSKISCKIYGSAGIKGLAVPKAPHYIVVSGGQQPLRNACAGFLLQHVDLYLYSMGYAGRWLGSAKSKDNNKDDIIGYAFGRPVNPYKRKPSDFKRKPLEEISKGSDSRFEAMRLAPSAINSQPWYFIKENEAVHLYYKKKLSGPAGFIYRTTDLDAGIALCHLQVASEHEGKPFNFITDAKNFPTPPENFLYLGSVK